jgi:ubiquinone/menaquinone biosynthesis C-methylase UbiE
VEPEEGDRLLVGEYSRMAAAYDRDYAPYHKAMVDRLLELARPSNDERVLELGCGTGVLAFEAVRHVGATRFVVGVDCAEGMIDVAVATANRARLGMERVRFARMDNRALAFVDGAFDIVLSCFGIAALGHARAFREAYRVLTTDGRFALCHYSGASKGPSVVLLLTKFRPREIPDEVRRLLEARRSINATGEPKAFGDPDVVVGRLRAIGFREVTRVAVEERVVYPSAAACLARGLAMGDNEREFRAMAPAVRAAFLEEFRDQAAPFVTSEGLVAVVGVNYVVARK